MKTKNKLITTAVIGAAMIGATQGHAHAEDIKNDTLQPSIEKESSTKKVTKDDVTKAETNVDNLQKQYTDIDNTNKKTNDQLNTAKTEKANIEANINNASQITPDDINKAKTVVTKAEQNLDDKTKKATESDKNANKSKSELGDAEKVQQNDADAVNKAKQKVDQLNKDAINVGHLEKEKTDKENELDKVKVSKVASSTQVDDLTTKLNDAKQKDAGHEVKLAEARDNEKITQEERDKAQKDLDKAKSERDKAEKALEDARGDNVLHEIKLQDEYIKANPNVILERVYREAGVEPSTKMVDENDSTKGYIIIGDPHPGTVYYNLNGADIDEATSRAWDEYQKRVDKAYQKYINVEYLTKEQEFRAQLRNAITNFYKEHKVPNGDKVIKINDMSKTDRDELTVYGVNLINSIREQLGRGKIKANGFMTDFGNEVGKVRVRDNITLINHYGKGINEVARGYGMSTSADPGVDTTQQSYENLYVSPLETSDGGVTKQSLYEYIAKAITGFILEGPTTGGNYGHFISIINAPDTERFGLGISYLDGNAYAGVYSTDPTTDWRFKDNALGKETIQKILNSDLSLGNDTSTLETAVRVARDKVQQKQAKLDEATIEHDKSKTELNKVLQYKSNVADIETKLNEAKSKVSDSVNKINTLTKEIGDLTTRINNANTSESTRQAMLRDAQDKLTQAEDKYKQSTDKVNTLKARLDSTEDEQKQAHAEVKKAQSELDAARKDVQDKQDAVTKLNEEKHKLQFVNQEIARLEQDKQDQETKLADLKTKLDDAIKEYNYLVLQYQLENPDVTPPIKVPTPETPNMNTSHKGDSTIHNISNEYFVGTNGERRVLPNTGVADNGAATAGLGLLAFVGGLFATKRRKKH